MVQSQSTQLTAEVTAARVLEKLAAPGLMVGVPSMDTMPEVPKAPKHPGAFVDSGLGKVTKKLTTGPKLEAAGTSTNKTAFLDDGLGPLLWGGAGGLGGYLAGEHLVNPLLAAKQKSIQDAMAKSELWLSKLEALKKVMPLLTAGGGALLLAYLAARSARADERARLQQYAGYNKGTDEYRPDERVQFNTGPAMFNDGR